jgi:hypothetical protein
MSQTNSNLDAQNEMHRLAHVRSDELPDEAIDHAPDPFHDAEAYRNDGEPRGSHDLSDDAEALASAGHGTDEDYGGYGMDGYAFDGAD